MLESSRMVNDRRYTTKEDLHDCISGEQYYIPGDPSTCDLTLKVTGGTTGVPAMSILGTQTWKYDLMSRFIRMAPKNTSTLAAIATALRHAPHHISVLPLNLQEYTNLTPVEFREAVSDFTPRELHTTRSLLTHVIEDMERKKVLDALRSLEIINMTGETASVEHLRHIRRVFPGRHIYTDYGTSEGGAVGFLCARESMTEKEPHERRYHPVADKVIEIINPDAEGFGEIVTTSKELKRYRSGDIGKIVVEDCECGASRSFYIKGRSGYDIAQCAGATFLHSEVERVFQELESTIIDYVLEVFEYNSGGVMRGKALLRIVPKRNTTVSEEEIARTARNTLLQKLYVTPTRTVGDLIRDDVFLPLEVEVVENIERGSAKRYHLRQVFA